MIKAYSWRARLVNYSSEYTHAENDILQEYT